MDQMCPSPDYYVEALKPNVTKFGLLVNKLILNEVIGWGSNPTRLMFYKKRKRQWGFLSLAMYHRRQVVRKQRIGDHL